MNLGIPYMGSKRKLAPEILKIITQRHSYISDFYDLCGGGGSVSFNAIKDYRFNVHYNELNKHIYCLVEYLKNNKKLEPRFYEWVTRDMFFEQINKSNDDADWYSGFVMSCWSFGNSQNSYLYGSDIEELKRLAHQFIVFGCEDSMSKLNIDIPELLDIKDIQKRRTVFCDFMKKETSGVEYVENMTRLQQLERIQNLQNLQITNSSYR